MKKVIKDFRDYVFKYFKELDDIKVSITKDTFTRVERKDNYPPRETHYIDVEMYAENKEKEFIGMYKKIAKKFPKHTYLVLRLYRDGVAEINFKSSGKTKSFVIGELEKIKGAIGE